jgi:uncharacterized protein (DUF1015 family)
VPEVLPFRAVRPAEPDMEGFRPAVEPMSPFGEILPSVAIPADRLLVDTEPALYAYKQDFRTDSGLQKNRLGLVCLISAGDGSLIGTQEAEAYGVERLIERMSATGLQETFLVAGYEDAKFKIDKILERGILEKRSPDIDLDAGRGERHRFWRIPSQKLVSQASQLVRAAECFLLDGAHTHRALRKLAGASSSPEGAPALAVLFNLLDFGMVLSSATLLIDEIAGFNINALALRMSTFFETRAFPFSSPRALPKALADFREDFRIRGFTDSVIGALFRDIDQFFLFTLKDDVDRDDVFLPDVKAPLRQFDSVLLRRVMLERYLGGGGDAAGPRIDYSWSVEEAVASVRARKHRAAFFSNPPNKRKIMALARAGFRLPPGSARIEPPIRTGLLMRRID